MRLWGCFAASVNGGLEHTEGIMKSEDHQGILEQTMLLNVRKLGIRQKLLVLQQSNDPIH